MKKVNFKIVVQTLAVVLAFLFVGVQSANAQASTTVTGISNPVKDPSLTTVLQGSYVNTSEAQDILTAELELLKYQLEVLPQGAPYNVALRTYIYYDGIQTELLNGKDVPQAISNGLGYLNDSNGHGNLTQAQKNQLVQAAIDLLSN